MNALKQEALQLIEDAKNIAENIDKVSSTIMQHSIAIICRRYAGLYVNVMREEKGK